jgi:hypothetical protein
MDLRPGDRISDLVLTRIYPHHHFPPLRHRRNDWIARLTGHQEKIGMNIATLEIWYERKIDALDKRYMNSPMTEAEYKKETKAINVEFRKLGGKL